MEKLIALQSKNFTTVKQYTDLRLLLLLDLEFCGGLCVCVCIVCIKLAKQLNMCVCGGGLFVLNWLSN